MKKLLIAFMALMVVMGSAFADTMIVQLTKDAVLDKTGDAVLLQTNKGKILLSTDSKAAEYFYDTNNPAVKGTCLYLSTDTEFAFIEFNKRLDQSNVERIKLSQCPSQRPPARSNQVQPLATMDRCVAPDPRLRQFAVVNPEKMEGGLVDNNDDMRFIVTKQDDNLLYVKKMVYQPSTGKWIGSPVGVVDVKDFYEIPLNHCY